MGGVADVMILSPGPVHTVLIINGTSTDGLNSTEQVSDGDVPDRIGLGASETRCTVGWGTESAKKMCMHHALWQNCHLVLGI